MEPHQLLNTGHGPAAPRHTPPTRRPDSVRRTTTIDIIRPEGFEPGLLLAGLGRDLWTKTDGEAVILDTASFEVDIEFPDSRQIRTIDTEPASPEIKGLTGQDSLMGFRRRVAELTAGSERTLLLHLLDDIPGATLIAGHSQLDLAHFP